MNKPKRNSLEDDSWSSISGDIFCLVAEKIKFIEDYVNFCAVCRRWYVLGSEFYKKLYFPPVYMFGIDPSYPNSESGINHNPIFPINPNPSPNLRFRSYGSERSFVIESPEASGRRCWGSPFGWLVTFGAADLEFSLLNPFTRATIALPSMSTLFSGFKYDPPWCFLKAFLTADPLECNDDCFVFVVFKPRGRKNKYRLAFARPGRDDIWYSVRGRNDLSDVISFQGKLYGVATECVDSVIVYSIQIQPYPRVFELVKKVLVAGDLALPVTLPGPDPDRDLEADYMYPGELDDQGRQRAGFCHTRKYLVDLNGELCLVLRHTRHILYRSGTIYFKVFKIDLSTRELTRVWPLGDRSLFLGNHSTFTHKTEACKSNRVLYTYGDEWLSYETFTGPIQPDVGVWDMLGCNKVYSSAETLTRYPPLWMIPSISFTKLEELGRLGRCRSKSKAVSEVVETKGCECSGGGEVVGSNLKFSQGTREQSKKSPTTPTL